MTEPTINRIRVYAYGSPPHQHPLQSLHRFVPANASASHS